MDFMKPPVQLLKFPKGHTDLPGLLFVCDAVGKDATRFNLTLVNVRKIGDQLVAEASDGHRAHRYTLTHPIPVGLYEIKIKKRAELVLVTTTEDVEYPDIDRVIPRNMPMTGFIDKSYPYRVAQLLRAMPDRSAVNLDLLEQAMNADMSEFNAGNGLCPILLTGHNLLAVVMPAAVAEGELSRVKSHPARWGIASPARDTAGAVREDKKRRRSDEQF